MRYDAAIIGAGADGLAAAATLAKSGLKTIVLERAEKPGGRLVTREFHPGFRASPFCDALLPIPFEIFWSLDLARRGAVFVPSRGPIGWWLDRVRPLTSDTRVLKKSSSLAKAALARAEKDEASPKRSFPLLGRTLIAEPWPGEEWRSVSLNQCVGDEDGDTAALLAAQALMGRAAHPDHAGSALHLLAPGEGFIAEGAHKLAEALESAARDAGAEISCGLEAAEVHRISRRVTGVSLADGTTISARGVISTLDLKRTFLSLFPWKALPADTAQRVASFRMSGSTARVLLALSKRPQSLFDMSRPIHVAPDMALFGEAYASWRSSVLPERLPVTLRVISSADPSLAPVGAAVVTVTMGCIPGRPFDGAWTHEKREALLKRSLAIVEQVFPDSQNAVVGSDVIVPPDIEEAIGLTNGDLWGGEIAPDQMLGSRPWLGIASPRTPFTGVYLAGPSSAAAPFGTCAAGVVAARALIADHAAGRL